jgi:hypothetical protein
MSEPTPAPTPAPPAGETPPAAPLQLPDDHPLVKTLAEQKKAIKDLKAKAQRLDEIEEATKSESEKAADRIAKAEAEAASVPSKVADALRQHLVALHEIDKDDAELFLTAADPDLLLKQVTRLLARGDEQAAARKKNGNHVPREGNNPSSEGGEDREFVRQLFASAE